jgi:uncharacterized cupredoxin-like copper-binding protein
MRRALIGLTATVAATAAFLPAFAGAQTTTPKVTTTKVTVTAGKPSEFGFVLSKKSVPKGTVVFTVKNAGNLPHDFKINGKKTPDLNPGKSATITVKFTKAGSFAYLCTVPGHAAAGMKGTFKVTG